MTDLKKYPHLSGDLPSILKAAVPLLGVREKPGTADNAMILEWADEVERALGVKNLGYTADSIPWCGLFVGVVAARAGWADQMPKTPLWARSWAEFGQEADKPSLGDILVFARNGGGHVGIYVGEDRSAFHVLGGNQSDAVTITRIAKSRKIAVRRPRWRVAQPTSVRPIRMGADGPLSTNEA